MPKVSIIIRTRNEERWISSCLESVFNQNYSDFEVVLVDNHSSDRTIKKAESYPVKVVTIEDYLPGKAINQGIRNSSGEIIVILSGHCIPVSDTWLGNLIKNLNDQEVAGVYGRQQPMSFSSDRDKRDLLTVFGLDKKIQKKDSFFHNANSAIPRKVLEKFPFDEKATNIEDRIWGKEVIAAGLKIVYEPSASVYHFHGIHQDQDPVRCNNVVRILEAISKNELDNNGNFLCTYDASSLKVIALIPAKGDLEMCGKRPLVQYTIEHALKAEHIDKVVVLTDNIKTADFSRELGAEVPFIRPPELSTPHSSIHDVIQHGINKLESIGYIYDICIIMLRSYPFRPLGFADDIIERFVREGAESMLPMQEEGRAIWRLSEGKIKNVSPLMPRHLKTDRFLVSHFGLGFVTYPKYLRDGSLGMDRACMYLVSDFMATIEVRGRDAINSVAPMLEGVRN